MMDALSLSCHLTERAQRAKSGVAGVRENRR